MTMSVSTDPTSLSGSGSVNLKIYVKNNGTTPYTDIVFNVDGTKVFTLPEMKKEYTYRMSYAVSSSKLDKAIPVTVTYKYKGGSDTKSIEKSFTVKKGAGGGTEASGVSINTAVSVSSTTVAAGDSVTFTFTVENTGSAKITDAKLTATNLNDGKQIGDTFSLGAGKATTISYNQSFDSSVVIQPKLKYTANGKAQTSNLDAVNITVGGGGETAAALDIVLSTTETAPVAGTPFNVDVKLTNNSGKDFNSVDLFDNNGEFITLDSSSLANGASLTFSYPTTLKTGNTVRFTASCLDANGEEYTFTSNELTFDIEPVNTPAASDYSSLLSLTVSADTTELEKPGDVMFTLTLKNDAPQDYTDITLAEASLGTIDTYPVFPNGEKSIEYGVTNVKTTTEFIFMIKATAPDGTSVEHTLPAIQINVAEPASGGMTWWLWLLIIVGAVLLIGAGVLVFLILTDRLPMGGNGGSGDRRAKDRYDDEEDIRPSVSSGRSAYQRTARTSDTARTVHATPHPRGYMDSTPSRGTSAHAGTAARGAAQAHTGRSSAARYGDDYRGEEPEQRTAVRGVRRPENMRSNGRSYDVRPEPEYNDRREPGYYDKPDPGYGRPDPGYDDAQDPGYDDRLEPEYDDSYEDGVGDGHTDSYDDVQGSEAYDDKYAVRPSGHKKVNFEDHNDF